MHRRSSGSATASDVLVLVLRNVRSGPSFLLFSSLNFPIAQVTFYKLLTNTQNWFLLSIQGFITFIRDIWSSLHKSYNNLQGCFNLLCVVIKISSRKLIHSWSQDQLFMDSSISTYSARCSAKNCKVWIWIFNCHGS